MKTFSTTKLHNFSRSTTFVLDVSPSKAVWKIQILNFRNQRNCLLDRLFQIKIFGHPNDLKLKKFELQSCRSRRVQQLWYKVCLHQISYETYKVFLQHITIDSSHEPTVIVLVSVIG